MCARQKHSHIPDRCLALQLKVAESERVLATCIADWVKLCGSVILNVHNSVVLRGDAGRNRFEAENLAKIIDFAVIGMRWKAAVTKKVLKVAVRRILPLEVVGSTNVDRSGMP